MNTQMQATQELSDAQLEAISGGCCKRYQDDDCYQKRDCERDSEEKSYCDDSYDSSGCDYDPNYSSCHERRRHHHGCR